MPAVQLLLFGIGGCALGACAALQPLSASARAVAAYTLLLQPLTFCLFAEHTTAESSCCCSSVRASLLAAACSLLTKLQRSVACPSSPSSTSEWSALHDYIGKVQLQNKAAQNSAFAARHGMCSAMVCSARE
jgi:hypothetical protein